MEQEATLIKYTLSWKREKTFFCKCVVSVLNSLKAKANGAK